MPKTTGNTGEAATREVLKTARNVLSGPERGKGDSPEEKAQNDIQNAGGKAAHTARYVISRSVRSARAVIRANAAQKYVAGRKRARMEKAAAKDTVKTNAAVAGRESEKTYKSAVAQNKKDIFGGSVPQENGGTSNTPRRTGKFHNNKAVSKQRNQDRRIAANTKKATFFRGRQARKAAKKGAQVGREAGQVIQAAAKTAKAAGRVGRAAVMASNPVGLIIAIAIVVIIIIVVTASLVFYSGAGANAVKDAWGEIGYLDTAVVDDIKKSVNTEWLQALREAREGLLEQGFLREHVKVRYNYTPETDNDGTFRLNNWDDVLAVWLVLNDRAIQPEDAGAVRDIYFTMNPFGVVLEDIPIEPITDEPPPEEPQEQDLPPDVPIPDEPPPVEPQFYTMAWIDVKNLRCADVAAQYGLSAEMLAKTDEWLNPVSEQNAFWVALLGSPVTQGDSYAGFYTSLPPGEAVTFVLNEAARRNGWIYDNGARMRDGFDDCSSLVWGCYMTAGIDFGDSGYAPTAASIAQWCDERNLRVDPAQIQAGDLIFWSGKGNGRYLNIYHVAIYVGDGKMWEAAPSAGGVIFRDVSIQRPSNIIFYARPTAA